jgi:hypothetical protein
MESGVGHPDNHQDDSDRGNAGWDRRKTFQISRGFGRPSLTPMSAAGGEIRAPHIVHVRHFILCALCQPSF